jgi:23S rRNA (cytosine1962-C5)-methyltransferase
VSRPDAWGPLKRLLVGALERRRGLIDSGRTRCFRAFSGEADGIDGLFIDVYGEGATLIAYEGRAPRGFEAQREASAVLAVLNGLGVKGVYLKPFAKDRSKMGGELPPVTTEATPAAGAAVSEALVVRELDWRLEVRLYDGLSTGIFLDQRENRAWVRDWCAARAVGGQAPKVLNTFAYTCPFSVAAAKGGAETTSVDVSNRYLEWGKRNLSHNGIDPELHRFAKMDTFEFLGYAGRKNLRYDLIVLDPPSFGSGSKKDKVAPWNSVEGYARLVAGAAALLSDGGVVLASTNTVELCRDNGARLEKEIIKGLGKRPGWMKLPAPPLDFAGERDRFAARAFSL